MKNKILSFTITIIFLFTFVNFSNAKAEDLDYAVYIYEDLTMNGGQQLVNGNLVVNGSVTGLNWDKRVTNGSLYADVTKIPEYQNNQWQRSTIDQYLSKNSYNGAEPDLSVELKDFPELVKKGSLFVNNSVHINESGWYSEIDITTSGNTDFTITANAGETIELRIDQLKLFNAIKVVGDGNVILYVENMTSGGVPRINEGGASRNVSLYLEENSYTLTNIHGNFNTYTKNSTVTFDGSTVIFGNIFSNGSLTLNAAVVNGFIGGENLSIHLISSVYQDGKLVPNITGKLVAKTANFQYGPLVKYENVSDIKENMPKQLNREEEPEQSTEYVNGLLGEYYDSVNMENESALRMKRIDERPFFSWGNETPDDVIEKEDFSVRFTGFIKPEVSGNYVFKTLSDDGVKLTIGDTQLINRWDLVNLEYTTAMNSIYLDANEYYPFELEYQQQPLNAMIFLFWQSEQVKMSSVPAAVFYIKKAVYNEYLSGKYYNQILRSGTGLKNDFYKLGDEKIIYTQTASISYDWGSTAPGTLNLDEFYGVMKGSIEPKFTEDISLSFIVDDAIKVWIDDALIIDAWELHDQEVVEGVFKGTAGKKHKIRIEYADFGGGATIIMRWESASQRLEIVSEEYLYAE